MKQLVPQEAAENRETGERPVRSRHCKQEHTASYMSLSNREGGGGRQTVSQETCQLWYGDDEFQITRFDCTEKKFFDNPTASARWIYFFRIIFI